MNTLAAVVEQPERLALCNLELSEPGPGDVVVDIDWTGISTGTERLLYTGRMPHFPGMGYPLVPGYESVGTVAQAGHQSSRAVGDRVFVPGANCFGDVRGLFGGAAGRVVVPGARVAPIDEMLGERGTLLALAATAYHALAPVSDSGEFRFPDLVVGHGILGRLLARLTMALGAPSPVVWEIQAQRRTGATGYFVIGPDDDDRHDYRSIFDASGDAGLLDTLIARLGRQGEIVLAGFYSQSLSFSFPPAFMREARLRVAAEWKPADLQAVGALVANGRLSLDGLITHRQDASRAAQAYAQAFDDPTCLKMILDWRCLQ